MADTSYLQENLAGFVPVEQANEIIKAVVRGSSILRLSNVQAMESDTKKIPVMVSGPGAYWVGESERIQTSTAQWIFPALQAKKIAVIVPVTREKMNDTTIDVFGEISPYIAEAFYKTIDAACLFGTQSPFTKNIFTEAGSQTVAVGSNARKSRRQVTTLTALSPIFLSKILCGNSVTGTARRFMRKALTSTLYIHCR